MKIKKFTTLAMITMFFISNSLTGQQDEKAGNILDQLSEKISSAPSVSIDFSIIISVTQDEFSDEYDGEVKMKGNKYKLNIMGMESWFDGSSTYTYMPDANEVIISDPDEDGGLMSNPTEIFTLYHEEFNYRLANELTMEGKKLFEIDLYPLDRNHNFHTVKLFINQDDYLLHSAVIASKDGNRYTLIVNDLDNSSNIPDSFFVFNESDYPDLEIIDMRW